MENMESMWRTWRACEGPKDALEPGSQREDVSRRGWRDEEDALFHKRRTNTKLFSVLHQTDESDPYIRREGKRCTHTAASSRL